MKLHPAALAAAVLALTLLSFFQFPGHTILQSDTQIYIPILEHLQDPTSFAKDVMATQPHVSFTLYDETALALRRVTGLSFEHVLQAQQFFYRGLGILGLYLIGTAITLLPWQALFVSTVVSLGAIVNGPAVLTVEYEPVPRGFALPFLLLSMGCTGHGRWGLAAICAGIGFGFHPPTALAYSGLLFVVLVWKKEFRSIALLAIVPAILTATALTGAGGKQPLLGTISPELEALQRMRATYNWVSLWFSMWVAHYLLLWIVGLIALWRLKKHIPAQLLVFFAGLPLIGILSVPVSYLLLERAKLLLMPQLQPGRYLLFVTLFAMFLIAAAAMKAAQKRRFWQAVLFLLIAFAIPMNENVLAALRSPSAAGLAATLAIVCAVGRKTALLPAAAAYFLIPFVVHVQNFPALHHREIDALAAWARESTPKDAVFQFADLKRDLSQGVFRARALRALYVDWKSGGQVNFLTSFAPLWSERWQKVQQIRTLDEYRSWGIDYVVFRNVNAPQGIEPVYKNERYSVFH